MKTLKLVAIIATSILFSQASFAQLTDFPNTCWQQKGVFQWSFSESFLIDRNVVTYSHDSTVCGTTYRALKRNSTSWGQSDSSYWFVRNESGKIYFSSSPSCVDTGILFYDFNLMAGDTFEMIGNIVNFPVVIQSVDYINLNGSSRKRLRISSYTVWIDGIGDSIHGLYYPDIGWEGAHYKMICQYDTAGWLFSNSWAPFTNDPLGNSHICDSIPAPANCFLPTNIVGPHQGVDALNIYPNPATENVTIDFSTQTKKFNVRVYNVLGALMLSSSEMSFNVNALANGLYVVKLESDHGIHWQRFLKQ